jgi:hypothetical protein
VIILTLTNKIVENHLRHPRSIKKIYNGDFVGIDLEKRNPPFIYRLPAMLSLVPLAAVGYTIINSKSLPVSIFGIDLSLPLLIVSFFFLLICGLILMAGTEHHRAYKAIGKWTIVESKLERTEIKKELTSGEEPTTFDAYYLLFTYDNGKQMVRTTPFCAKQVRPGDPVWLCVKKNNDPDNRRICSFYFKKAFENYSDGFQLHK